MFNNRAEVKKKEEELNFLAVKIKNEISYVQALFRCGCSYNDGQALIEL